MAKAAALVEAIERHEWKAALLMAHTAANSLVEALSLDPFAVPLEVRCQVKGQAPWQVKLKTRAERCTGIYHPSEELVNNMPCWRKIGSDKDGDGQVWLCFTSNGPGHERYMIQHVRVRGQSKGYARCKLSHTKSAGDPTEAGASTGSNGHTGSGDNSSSSGAGGGFGGSSSGGSSSGSSGGGVAPGGDGAPRHTHPTTPTGLVISAPHQVRLWQVHDGIDWSVCEEFVVAPVLPIPLLAALQMATPTPSCRLSSVAQLVQEEAKGSLHGSSRLSFTDIIPSSTMDTFVAPCLTDFDVARAFCASRSTCAALVQSMASRDQWRVIAAILEQDPKAAELKMRDGSLPRDVACNKGAPLELIDAFVQRTPYASLADATSLKAHSVHLDRIIHASPLATALRRLGFGPVEIGRLMADNSLGLSSEKDLVHLRYDELVRAGVTAVNARKAMSQLQAFRISRSPHHHIYDTFSDVYDDGYDDEYNADYGGYGGGGFLDSYEHDRNDPADPSMIETYGYDLREFDRREHRRLQSLRHHHQSLHHQQQYHSRNHHRRHRHPQEDQQSQVRRKEHDSMKERDCKESATNQHQKGPPPLLSPPLVQHQLQHHRKQQHLVKSSSNSSRQRKGDSDHRHSGTQPVLSSASPPPPPVAVAAETEVDGTVMTTSADDDTSEGSSSGGFFVNDRRASIPVTVPGDGDEWQRLLRAVTEAAEREASLVAALAQHEAQTAEREAKAAKREEELRDSMVTLAGVVQQTAQLAAQSEQRVATLTEKLAQLSDLVGLGLSQGISPEHLKNDPP